MTWPAKQLAAVESGIWSKVYNHKWFIRGTDGMIDANNLLFCRLLSHPEMVIVSSISLLHLFMYCNLQLLSTFDSFPSIVLWPELCNKCWDLSTTFLFCCFRFYCDSKKLIVERHPVMRLVASTHFYPKWHLKQNKRFVSLLFLWLFSSIRKKKKRKSN